MILINGLLLYKCRKAKRLHPQMNFFFKKNFKLDSVQVYKCKEVFQKKKNDYGIILKESLYPPPSITLQSKKTTL